MTSLRERYEKENYDPLARGLLARIKDRSVPATCCFSVVDQGWKDNPLLGVSVSLLPQGFIVGNLPLDIERGLLGTVSRFARALRDCDGPRESRSWRMTCYKRQESEDEFPWAKVVFRLVKDEI